jgi:hypothetical protein
MHFINDRLKDICIIFIIEIFVNFTDVKDEHTLIIHFLIRISSKT